VHPSAGYPRRQLHIVVNNYATHKYDNVSAWLGKNKRITLHFTPTSGSWLNLVEIFFGIITRQAVRRGAFTSVKDLIRAIETFIDGWNERCEPFVWTKPADDIVKEATQGHSATLVPWRSPKPPARRAIGSRWVRLNGSQYVALRQWTTSLKSDNLSILYDI
jgi:hypothetical protein